MYRALIEGDRLRYQPERSETFGEEMDVKIDGSLFACGGIAEKIK